MNEKISLSGKQAITTPLNRKKSTDMIMRAKTTTYFGKVVCIVHVFSDEAFIEYAEHYVCHFQYIVGYWKIPMTLEGKL